MKNEEFDLIKEELIRRFKPISEQRKQLYTKAKGLEKLTALKEKVANLTDVSDEYAQILNEILEERNVSLEGGKKQELIAYLKPTTAELLREYIRP